MKKKLLKGEIATIITLGTLIVVGISSLVSTVFLKKTQTTKTKAAGCSQVSNVSYSGNVAAGQTFTCSAVTDGASRYTMACGISKNGGWPYGMKSGSCSRRNCTFSVKMDDQIDAGAVYDLVAFDFRAECGPNTGKKITLNVSGAQPQPTQANCDQECCGKPDGFIYQKAIKERCESNYKGGRYVIIDGVCQGGKKTEKPGCATCKTCQAGAPDVSPVPGTDLAVNECTSSCEQNGGGICSGLPDCQANITPAIVRSCSDTSFSCTSGYTACKKDGAIWCYGSGRSGGGSSGSSGGGNPIPSPTPTPTRTPIPTTPPPEDGTSVISPTSEASARTPTSITAISYANQVINLKGTASFFINLSNSQYLNYFKNNFFKNIFRPFLTKHQGCFLGARILNVCHPNHILNINNNSLEIKYNDLQRYYYDNGLKPINYTFELSSSFLNNFNYTTDFVFPNFYSIKYSQNTGKTIDLSQFLRMASLKFKKENNCIYQDGDNLSLDVSPSPSLYFYNNQNINYIDKVGFDKEIKFIYNIFDYQDLPMTILINIYYKCAPSGGSSFFYRSKEIKFGNLYSTEIDGGEFILTCSN